MGDGDSDCTYLILLLATISFNLNFNVPVKLYTIIHNIQKCNSQILHGIKKERCKKRYEKKESKFMKKILEQRKLRMRNGGEGETRRIQEVFRENHVDHAETKPENSIDSIYNK